MKQESNSGATKIIVVGMNPSTYLGTVEHRKNHTFDRLYQWMNTLNVPLFSFINVWHTPEDFKISDVDINYLSEAVRSYDKVIALGNIPSQVLARINKMHFKLPHPSPKNRVLNNKVELKRILDECNRYVNS